MTLLIRTNELPRESRLGVWLLGSVLVHGLVLLSLVRGWWDPWRPPEEEPLAPVQLVVEPEPPLPVTPPPRQPMPPTPQVRATFGSPRPPVFSPPSQPVTTAPTAAVAPPTGEPRPSPVLPPRTHRPGMPMPGEGPEALGPAPPNAESPTVGGSAPTPSFESAAEALAPVAPPAPKESSTPTAPGTPVAVAPVTCVRCPQPPYPAHLRQQGMEGRVALTIDVGPDGRVTAVNLRQSSGSPQLDEVAIQAVWRWQFTTSSQGRQGLNVSVRFQLR
ncbi:MAG: TonB family protein [Gloeomargarita sp. GMQP_bins_120]